MIQPKILTAFAFLFILILTQSSVVHAFPVGPYAWNDEQWGKHCGKVRTTYNTQTPLSTTALTLTPADERFVDFLYWVWANKIIEHQVEQVGGTEWDGPTNGVIFHWAPGSRWETHTVAPFKHAIHHLVEEHYWTDRMFPEFFEPFGKVSGVTIDQRLSSAKAPTWKMFLKHIGGPESPYYRFVFHQESAIDQQRQRVVMVGGQGVAFEYTYERYLHEVQAVLTDCKSYQFFQLYDLHGKGFSSKPGWAGQPIPSSAKEAYGQGH